VKILQLSDLHIAAPGTDTYGIDVRANFLACLEAGRLLGAQRIAITGDLCFREADPEVYGWLREELDRCGTEWAAIPGNHDGSAEMAGAFGMEERLQGGELYWREEWAGRRIFFLDTARGDISQSQLDWLGKGLAEQDQREAPLVFMHHPPVPLGVPYMDRLEPRPDSIRFLAALGTSQRPPHVFTGHYHVGSFTALPEATFWACPSTFYQICQSSEDFRVDHRRPGFRMVNILPKGIRCSLHHLEEGRQG
jgi:3',5'-cyclic-AMP phosphodiesterase